MSAVVRASLPTGLAVCRESLRPPETNSPFTDEHPEIAEAPTDGQERGLRYVRAFSPGLASRYPRLRASGSVSGPKHR